MLLLQGHRETKDQRFWSEVLAAGLTSAAAGIELLAVGTEQALSQVGPNSVTARGASISLGRYRLWGAGLASAAGLVSMWWDVKDAKDSFQEEPGFALTRKTALGSAYTIRSLATLALLSGQGGIALSQAGAYFSWLAARVNTTAQKIIFLTLSQWSTRIAANQAAMLLLGRMTWVGGAIVLVSTVVLLILYEDDLAQWCDRCCYSLSASNKRYADNEDELGALFNAIGGIA